MQAWSDAFHACIAGVDAIGPGAWAGGGAGGSPTLAMQSSLAAAAAGRTV